MSLHIRLLAAFQPNRSVCGRKKRTPENEDRYLREDLGENGGDRCVHPESPGQDVGHRFKS